MIPDAYSLIVNPMTYLALFNKKMGEAPPKEEMAQIAWAHPKGI